MFKVIALAGILTLAPLAALASDAVEKGTVEVGGATTLLFNKQTLTPKDSNGNTVQGATDTDLTQTTVGLEGAYYLSDHLGIGATVNYFKIKLDFGGTTTDTSDLSGGNFGGLLKYRFPLSPKADLVVSGAGGIAMAKNTSQFGNSSSTNFDVSGPFWLGGAAVSFALNNNASVDFGLSYQSTSLKDQTATTNQGKIQASGIIAALGFAIFLH
jgi:hypothetical protein